MFGMFLKKGENEVAVIGKIGGAKVWEDMISFTIGGEKILVLKEEGRVVHSGKDPKHFESGYETELEIVTVGKRNIFESHFADGCPYSLTLKALSTMNVIPSSDTFKRVKLPKHTPEERIYGVRIDL